MWKLSRNGNWYVPSFNGCRVVVYSIEGAGMDWKYVINSLDPADPFVLRSRLYFDTAGEAQDAALERLADVSRY